jgi:type IV pilus assembly protein PilB
MPRKRLGEMLVEAGVLSEQGLRMALNEQKRWGGTIGRTVVDMKLVSESELVRVLAQQLTLPTVDLDNLDIHPTVLDLVPAELADHHCIVPFAQPMKFLDVAMADPTNLGIIDELRIRTQLNIRPYLAGPKMIERAIAKYYRRIFGKALRRSDVPLETAGDTVPLTITGNRPRPDADEIEAARRREGLVQAPRRPTPLGVPTAAPQAAHQPPPPIDALGVLGPPGAGPASRDAEIDALQERISKLEALVARDESVLRKLLGLLVDKGIATREEILERLR